jgi:hypothetical protein
MAEGMPIGSVSYVISGEKTTKVHHDSLEQLVRVLKAAVAQITAALSGF